MASDRLSGSRRSDTVIREEDQPRPALMKRFDEIQANAILDLRLRNLAKLEGDSRRKSRIEAKAELETTLVPRHA